MVTEESKIIHLQDVGMPRRLTPEASRMAALEAARSLLLEAGPQAVTLKAVAGRIGERQAAFMDAAAGGLAGTSWLSLRLSRLS